MTSKGIIRFGFLNRALTSWIRGKLNYFRAEECGLSYSRASSLARRFTQAMAALWPLSVISYKTALFFVRNFPKFEEELCLSKNFGMQVTRFTLFQPRPVSDHICALLSPYFVLISQTTRSVALWQLKDNWWTRASTLQHDVICAGFSIVFLILCIY